jgi:hypothetical protein
MDQSSNFLPIRKTLFLSHGRSLLPYHSTLQIMEGASFVFFISFNYFLPFLISWCREFFCSLCDFWQYVFTSCPYLSNSNGANKIELRSQWVFEWKSQKDQNGAFLDFIWLLLSMTQTLPIEKIFKSNHNKVQQYKCKPKSKLHKIWTWSRTWDM